MSHPSNPSAEIAGNSSSSAGNSSPAGNAADQNAEIDHAAIQRGAFAAFLTFARGHAGKYFFKILKVEDKWTRYMREGEEAGNVVGQQAGNVAERWFKTLELRKWTVFDGISVTPGERVLFASEKQIVGSATFVEFVTIPDRATLDLLVKQHLLSCETDKKRYDQMVEALAPSWDSKLDSSTPRTFLRPRRGIPRPLACLLDAETEYFDLPRVPSTTTRDPSTRRGSLSFLCCPSPLKTAQGVYIFYGACGCI